MIQGAYLGDHRTLFDRTALLQDKGDHWLAQFDTLGLPHPETGVRLSEGWHRFDKGDFEVIYDSSKENANAV